MSIFKKESPKVIGVSFLQADTLYFLVFRFSHDGRAQRIAKKEFPFLKLTTAERKHEMHLFLATIGNPRMQFRHLIMRERAFTKQFQFPSRNMTEIKQMLKLRLPREIPSALDEIVYHFHPIKAESKIANIQTAVLLFGVSKDAINHDYDILRSFGINPDYILLTTIALSGYLRKTQDTSKRLSALLLYGNRGKGEALFYSAQGIQMSRTFSYDITDLAHSTDSGIRPVLNLLDQDQDKKSYVIYLSGELYNTESEWLVTRNAIDVLPEMADARLSPADFLCTAASETSEDECEEFNLLPEDIKGRIHVASVQKSWAHLRLSVVVCLAAILLVSFSHSLRTLFGISYLNRQLSVLDPTVKETKEISRKVKLLNRLMLDKIRPIDVFIGIHEQAGSEIQLNELEYNAKDKSVRMKGVSALQSSIDQYVKALGNVAWFSKAELQYSESSRDAKALQFQFSVRASLKTME